MEQVIYTKYSSERKKEYGILTKIIMDDTKQCVRKYAIFDEAKTHLHKLYSNMTRLENYYKSEKMVVIPCVVKEDGAVEFEFVAGERYDEYFSSIVAFNDMDNIKIKLKDLKVNLSEVEQSTVFEQTKEFKEVFGEEDYAILEGKEAYVLSNIDMIFSNMIMKDDKIYLTDYEWVFDFPVPIDFVLYRSLLLNIEFSMMKKEHRQEILEFLNISVDEMKCYDKMEENFQAYVSGKNIFSEYRKNSTKRTIPLNQISEKVYPNLVKTICKNKSDEIVSMTISQYKNSFTIKQKLIDDISQVQVQLQVKGAILQLQECYAMDEVGEKIQIPVSHNASFFVNKDYYFDADLPFFEIKNNGYQSIYIQVKIYFENSSVIGYYIQKIQECELKNQQVLRSEDKIAILENKVAELQSKIDQIKSTKAWKLYSKIKKIKDKI